MNAAQVHLMTVHLPVVGCLAAAVLLAVAIACRSELVFKVSLGFVLFVAATSGIAYLSGPGAYDIVQRRIAEEISDQDAQYAEYDRMEHHAVLGKISFTALIVLGVLALVASVNYLQGERPPAWLRVALLVAALGMSYMLAWTAHEGGSIRHTEIRSPNLPIFP